MLRPESHDHIQPDFLWALLERHRILPEAFANNPAALVQIASSCSCVAIMDGDEFAGFIVESYLQPNVIDIMPFVLDRSIVKRKEELMQMQDFMRERWFNERGARRVQSYIPVARKNSKRLLYYLGFTQETKDCGLRDLLRFGKKNESCIAMGLLPGDPVRAKMVQEVSHGI